MSITRKVQRQQGSTKVAKVMKQLDHMQVRQSESFSTLASRVMQDMTKIWGTLDYLLCLTDAYKQLLIEKGIVASEDALKLIMDELQKKAKEKQIEVSLATLKYPDVLCRQCLKISKSSELKNGKCPRCGSIEISTSVKPDETPEATPAA